MPTNQQILAELFKLLKLVDTAEKRGKVLTEINRLQMADIEEDVKRMYVERFEQNKTRNAKLGIFTRFGAK